MLSYRDQCWYSAKRRLDRELSTDHIPKKTPRSETFNQYKLSEEFQSLCEHFRAQIPSHFRIKSKSATNQPKTGISLKNLWLYGKRAARILVLKGDPHAVDGQSVLLIFVAMAVSRDVTLQFGHIGHILHTATQTSQAIVCLFTSNAAFQTHSTAGITRCHTKIHAFNSKGQMNLDFKYETS